MEKTLWAKVTLRLEALHQWPEAPAEVEFLKHPHRHMFHITVHVRQFHQNRDVEYLMLKRKLARQLGPAVDAMPMSRSCEHIAELILQLLQVDYPGRAMRVEVLEDGENGALVEYV